jgi:long-chain acyl-CoA synthetase
VVAAAVIPRKGIQVSVQALLDFSKEKLSSYKRPKKIFLVEDLPKNLFGKVVRKELKKQFAGK